GAVMSVEWVKSKHAKSVCMPSSRPISLLENVTPGSRPHFFNQKIDARDPEKNIPLTAANVTRRS
ncbi:hypothetical protein CONPUDRAFT_18249, partial [Coniophora puteana RWD-64-598 SS2]